MGFVFNLEGWIFNNIGHINEVLTQGGHVYGLTKKIFSINYQLINQDFNSQRILEAIYPRKVLVQSINYEQFFVLFMKITIF